MPRKTNEHLKYDFYRAWLARGRQGMATIAREHRVNRSIVHGWIEVVKREIADGTAPPEFLDNPQQPTPTNDFAAQLASVQEQLARLTSLTGGGGATPQTQSNSNVAGLDVAPPVSEITRPRVAPAVLDSPAFERWRTAPGRKDTDVYRVLVTPDPQIPYHDTVACRAVELYAADNFFNEWVDLGDFLDLDFLSRHNVGKHRQNAGKILKEHYAAAREVLDRRLAILRRNNPDGAMTMLEGNHDYRVENLLDETPFLEGLVEVEEGLGLKERDVRWVRFWRDGTVHRIGKAGFAHGRYISKYHAAKMVETYCDNIFYGHTHDVMEFPKIMHGRDKVIVGQSMGCLCRYDQSYIKENPKNWQQAFGDFYFLPSGHFTYYVPRIIEGRFVAPNGRIYSGWEGA